MSKKAKAKVAASLHAAPEPVDLLYKVVELSNVDESSMEDTINTWVGQGWTFDGVQFAMRESSKRPAMAFVFFTRTGRADDGAHARDPDEAQRTLRRLAAEPDAQPAPVSAWERLAQLAADDDDDP